MKVEAKHFSLPAVTFAALVLMEIFFRGFTEEFDVGPYFGTETAIALLILLGVALVVFFFRVLLPPRASKIFYGIAMGLIALMFAAQCVYYCIFETFFTTYSMFNGAQVVEFQDVIWLNIWREKFAILLIAGICAGAVFFSCREKTQESIGKWDGKEKVFVLICTLVLAMLSVVAAMAVALPVNSEPDSPHQNIYGVGEIQGTVRSAGLIGGMGIDMFKLIFHYEPTLMPAENEIETVSPQNQEPLTEKNCNMIEKFDFEKLAEETTDSSLKALDAYFASLKPTLKNEKTGIFKGKNLIFITAESFTDFTVDPEYTPTLYKMQNQGYKFNNYYNPIWGVSTLDGEYVNLQSLVPKPGVWSMKESGSNDLPFTLGNQFRNAGYATKAYHNHSIFYYDRDYSHPNLGYDFKGAGREYSFEKNWPESDLEMIDKTTPDFLTPGEDGKIKPFHIYYLTVSGHMNYNFRDNDMAIKNQDAVADMDLSDECRAYMAANIELDKAMELLIQRLDEAGELENTVIVLAGDHYPYALKEEHISEFRGHPVDETYELYKSSLILWNAGMEPESVEKLCCNMDILPTLSNMFGLEYDSRLMMGRDIFSDSEGFVLFKDKNWITERGTREELLKKDEEYVEKVDKKAEAMFNASTLVLDKNYYGYLMS